MVLDGPILALSDIMHGIAPSPDTPVPQEDDVEKIHTAESLTPEPLDYAQIELMRKRVLELIVSGASKMNTSSREKELVEMVIRLTSVRTPEPDANQLCSQAKTIEELCRQRDFIMKGVEEERARWAAERVGFDRVAEALIARRSHGRDHQSTYREEELERQVAALDTDNRALRQKLSEYHIRVQSVEAELAQLRPVLLMQPYAVTHSIPPSHNHYWHSSAQKADITRRVKRRKHGDADQDVTEEEPDNTVMASSTPRTRPRGDYYRRRDTDPFGDNSRHRRRTQKKGSATLADARAEHMLLAARKLGRERASILAVSSSAASRDKIKNDGDLTEVAPKTPRKQQTVGVGNGSSTGVIYLNSPIPAMADTASVEHVSSDFSPAQTPLIHRKPVRSQATPERAPRPNPFTPLDSLLTAASTISMIEDKDDEDDDGDVELDRTPSASTKGSARRLPAMSVGSPAPTKRRRLASSRPGRSLMASVTTPDRKSPSGGTGRTRSALDVLADQAAVFSSQKHDRAPSTDRAKGKGKAKEPDKGDTDVDPDEGPSPSLAIGNESGRQKPHMLNRAPPRQRAATRQLRPSASTLSPSSQPTSVTDRGHDPPSHRASEMQGLLPSPERAPPGAATLTSPHPFSVDSPQGMEITPPQNTSIS